MILMQISKPQGPVGMQPGVCMYLVAYSQGVFESIVACSRVDVVGETQLLQVTKPLKEGGVHQLHEQWVHTHMAVDRVHKDLSALQVPIIIVV